MSNCKPPLSLYDPSQEHDSCGVGFIAHIKNRKSHSIVQQGLSILKNLEHRGATGYDPLLGDGAGILVQMPDEFLRHQLARQKIELPPVGGYGCVMTFLPQDAALRSRCESLLEERAKEEGLALLAWRDVPCDNSGLADHAKATEPVIRQAFLVPHQPATTKESQDRLERKLFVARHRTAHAVRPLLSHGELFYMPSSSSRTLIYKGMLLSWQVESYFRDLSDPLFTSALALVHQRFSTNTFPTWSLAHPFRMIAHNGEINTLRGNVNWMAARQGSMASRLLGKDLEHIWPIIVPGTSDSACFDNVLELLVMSGYSLTHAMTLMIPEAWESNALMEEKQREYYAYQAACMEPWDGPADIAFTDGRQIGATLDRNGLRPARYLVTDDDLVVMASEHGVLPIAEERIIKKWRLQPGRMLLVDLELGRIIDDAEVKRTLAASRPHGQWLKNCRLELKDLLEQSTSSANKNSTDNIATHESQHATEVSGSLHIQQAFGFTQEDFKFILRPMADKGEEAVGSMGNDAALAVLSNQYKNLYQYFKQSFAQVTNPPIDPIREELVMSLTSYLGPQPNLLEPGEIAPLHLKVSQPILTCEELTCIEGTEKITAGKLHSKVLDITAACNIEDMARALEDLAQQSETAVRAGVNLLILSDRKISPTRVALPALLATATVHHQLVRCALRARTGLVVDTGSAREVHHFALLAGYGAQAICPWLVLSVLNTALERKNYIKAVGKGLYKVMSKMGISTYQSYCGAQIFEAVGLNRSLINRHFPGTASQIEGIDLRDVLTEALTVHQNAYSNILSLVHALPPGGEYAWRPQNGEAHMWTPDTIAKLQQATRTNQYSTFQEYSTLINEQSRRHMTLRGLFEIRHAPTPIPLAEVESAKDIVKRFVTGAISLGAISTEAHTALALAMNRIGGKSNTGEGGEDPLRFDAVTKDTTLQSALGDGRVVRDLPMKAGDSLRSRIKQVASGRFGVTLEYLASADQIQIKMAQGAKPGEGGQLPGHKVSEYIGYLRHSVPGVGLISPPPHHDIYSIEDLAQLIHDLKNANPRASISVKLVSEVGVGTIAAGVAKAKSDHVTIAGHDGGTGASPISSIMHAGTPWELGLAETQQTLLKNRLRARIVVQVDGQLKTGRDVVIGALLGADEFGFATAPLVVAGCIMMRKCHLNTCPVGVATQDPELRKRFSGQPEHIINFFFFIAEEVRAIMAQMGIRRFADLIGRSDLLDTRKGIAHWKAKGLDFAALLNFPQAHGQLRHHDETQNHLLEHALDHYLISQAEATLKHGTPMVIACEVRNIHRTVGTMLSAAVLKNFRQGLPEGTLRLELTGCAGQSLGAFLIRGVTLCLQGESNDYVGKGLSGGQIMVRPAKEFRGAAEENILIGNTALYGATTGDCYFNGVAGERFAVRNSGAVAVVEGVGDHGCEYMTGGAVVVLGDTGRNFAAGMSGGLAFVWDPKKRLPDHCNTSMVKLLPMSLMSGSAMPPIQLPLDHAHMDDESMVHFLITRHAAYTDSSRAKFILANWEKERRHFVKVFPNEYRRVLSEIQDGKHEAAA